MVPAHSGLRPSKYTGPGSLPPPALLQTLAKVQSPPVTITLNGEPFTIPAPLTIAGLLARLDIDPRGVAVEQNFIVVKRDRYATAGIAEGDQIEIVNFVGGGSGNRVIGETGSRVIG
jgi:sulfur carrier protein